VTAPAPPAPAGPPGSPRPSSRRGVVLVAVLLTLVLAVALVVFVMRPTTTPAPRPSAGAETSAGVLLGWGEPNYSQEFEGPLGPEWRLYDGPGHVGNGVRSPAAITVDDGLLTITGDSEGTTGGMALFPGQMHGRWEARVRAPVGDESYHALLLLWPDAEDWPVGGEVDFMEMLDPARQKTEIFVHYGPDNSQVQGEVLADGTQWQNWAVEWSPEHIIAYLNGNEWYRTSDPEVFPPGPMHLAIQLDWFPENGVGEVQETQMQVDWVKQYSW
jgi:glycosyl hydrolase family 16